MADVSATSLLAQLDDRRAFDATLGFDALAPLHVAFDTINGNEAMEARLRRNVSQGRRVVLQGASGEGKSSVISSVLGGMTEDAGPIFPIRIKVPTQEVELAGNTTAFLSYVLAQILKWSDPDVGRLQRRQFRRRLAQTRDRQEMKHAGLSMQLWAVQPALAKEVTTTIKGIDGLGDAVGELNRVIELLNTWDKSPVFVLDDTDTWLRHADPRLDRSAIASGFFTGPLRCIAKDIPVGLVLAAHPSYVDMPEYHEALALLDRSIPIPRFDDRAEHGLNAILERRVQHVLGAGAILGDYVDDDAVLWFAKYYRSRGGQSLRSTLRVANLSLAAAREAGASQVSGAFVEYALGKELG